MSESVIAVFVSFHDCDLVLDVYFWKTVFTGVNLNESLTSTDDLKYKVLVPLDFIFAAVNS